MTPEERLQAQRRSIAPLKALLRAKRLANELAEIAIEIVKNADYDGEAMAVRVYRLHRAYGLDLSDLIRACGYQALAQRDPSKAGYTVHEYDQWLMRIASKAKRAVN